MKNILEIKYHKTFAFLAICFGFFCVVHADYKAIKKQQRDDIRTETREDYVQSKLPAGAAVVDSPLAGMQKLQQEKRVAKKLGIEPENVRGVMQLEAQKNQHRKEVNEYLQKSKTVGGKDVLFGKDIKKLEQDALDDPEKFYADMIRKENELGKDQFSKKLNGLNERYEDKLFESYEYLSAKPSEQLAIDIEKEERAGGIKVQEGKKVLTQPGRATKVAEDIFADIEAEEGRAKKKQEGIEFAEIAEARVIVPWKKGVIPSEREAAEKVETERKQALDEFDKEIRPLQQELDKDVDVLNKKLEEQKQKRALQKKTEENLVKDLKIRPDQLSVMESIRARGKEFEYETKQDTKTGKYLVKDPDTKKWVPFEDNPITKIGKYVEDMNKVGAPVILPKHKQQAAQAKNTFDKLPASAKKKWSNMTYGQKAGALAGIGVAATAIAGMIALAVVDPAGVFDAEASARNAATLPPTEGQITQDTVQKQEPADEITRDAKQSQREEEIMPVGAGTGYEFIN